MPSAGSSDQSPRKILIIAAEASSCLYAQRLLQHWKKHNISVEAFGIGDQSMADEGFECLGRAEELAVMGIAEIVSHWGVISRAFHAVIDAAAVRRPDVVLLLDYPGFNLRFAKKLKGMNIPVVYYISPQVWAWKQGRVKLIKKVIAKMLVVFPFEVDFYAKHDVKVEFVGHPLLDELNPAHLDEKAREFRRSRYGIRPGEVVLALMPGSRVSEIKQHLEIQIRTARELLKKHPNMKVALFVAPNFQKEQMQSWLSDLNFPLMLIKDEPFSMIDLADVVLCASGTATLMVGLLEKPMVIMYRMKALTAFLAKRFVTSTKYFGLINLVLDKLAVREVFQEEANVQNLVSELEPLITSPQKRAEIAATLRTAKDRLGQKGATERVAQALEEYWKIPGESV